MRLILHVGMAKTGTSTLQDALTRNPKALARVGVLYPKPAFGKSNHNLISALVQDEQGMPREFLQRGATVDDALALATQFWADITSQVRRTKAQTTVLSGEYFYGLSEEKVHRLQGFLAEEFDQIDVVAYVREPGAYYVSLMQQRVKGAANLRPLSKFHTRVKVCLPRLASAFGAEMTVRAFERSALVGNDIVVDFLSEVLGLSVEAAAAVDIEDQNVSMSAEAMCILQLVRRYAFPDEEMKFAPESNLMIRRLNELRGDLPQSAPRLRADLAAAVVRRHREDLTYLADTFGVRFSDIADPLAADAPDPPGWDSPDLRDLLDVDRSQIDEVMAGLLKDLAGTGGSARKRRGA